MAKIGKKDIQNIMTVLKVSEEEAKSILDYDDRVDRSRAKDAPLEYDLPKDKEKQALKDAHKDKKIKTNYEFTTRERKANPTKGGIIDYLATALTDGGYNEVNKKNPEREITFTVDGTEFSLVLTQHRKPKGEK